MVAWLRGSFNGDNDGTIFVRVRNTNGTWGTTHNISGDNTARVSIDQSTSLLITPDNRFHITFITSPNDYVRYAYSDDQGSTWQFNNPGRWYLRLPIILASALVPMVNCVSMHMVRQFPRPMVMVTTSTILRGRAVMQPGAASHRLSPALSIPALTHAGHNISTPTPITWISLTGQMIIQMRPSSVSKYRIC